MRIISGKLKARRFTVPKGFPSRPTTDFAKEGLFNMLENRMSLVNLSILDLCAGTGNISFEFISRESGTVTAVDQNFKCIQHIYKNATSLNVLDEIRIVKSEIIRFIDQTKDSYDLIFADPPYDYKEHVKLAESILSKKIITPTGILIIEHGKQTDLSLIKGYEFTRQYGNVYFSFFNSIVNA